MKLEQKLRHWEDTVRDLQNRGKAVKPIIMTFLFCSSCFLFYGWHTLAAIIKSVSALALVSSARCSAAIREWALLGRE
jgi:hypothetical protein